MREKRMDLYYWLGFFLLSIYSGAIAIYMGADLRFTSDEYSLLTLLSEANFFDMFSPYVGHLTFLSQLIYRIILEVFGSDHYLPFQVAMVLSRIFLAAMVFLYAKRKIGPPLGLLLATLILFFNADWLHALFGNGMIILLSLALGLLSLFLVEEEKKKFVLLAMISLSLSMSIYTVGVPFAIAVFVYSVIFKRKTVWVSLIPLSLYGFWRIFIASKSNEVEDGGINFSKLADAPKWAFEQTAFTIKSIFPGFLGQELALILSGLFFLAVLMVLVFKKDWQILPPLAGLLSLYAAQVIVSGSIRGSEEEIERYLYPNLVFILLVAIFLIKAINWKYTPAALALIVILSVGSNLTYLEDKLPYLKAAKITREAEIAGSRIALSASPPVEDRSQPRGLGKSTLRANFNWKKASEWGPVGFSPKNLPAKDDRINRATDQYLFLSYKIKLEDPLAGKTVCRKASGKIMIPWSGINILAAGNPKVNIGRFSHFPSLSLGKINGTQSIKIRPDQRRDNQWFFVLRPSMPAIVCE